MFVGGSNISSKAVDKIHKAKDSNKRYSVISGVRCSLNEI